MDAHQRLSLKRASEADFTVESDREVMRLLETTATSISAALFVPLAAENYNAQAAARRRRSSVRSSTLRVMMTGDDAKEVGDMKAKMKMEKQGSLTAIPVPPAQAAN